VQPMFSGVWGLGIFIQLQHLGSWGQLYVSVQDSSVPVSVHPGLGLCYPSKARVFGILRHAMWSLSAKLIVLAYDA